LSVNNKGTVSGITTGGKGGTISQALDNHGGAESLGGAPKSPNNFTSTFFNTVNFFLKDLRFEYGAPNVLFAPGAV